MARLAQTAGLTDIQQEILSTVRDFVDKEIIPVATELEHRDEYPTEIVEGLKELGLFGLMIPEEYGGLGESLLTYALCVEEIARGWMSVSGIINTHFIVAYMLLQHGTDEQKQKYLPRMATGEVRGAFSMSEPGCGSDVAAIKTKATRDDDGYVINGQKMWLTNGGSSNLVAVLVKTDEGQDSVYKNMTTFLVEKEPGFGEVDKGLTIPGKIEKMGYKGVDTTEMILEGVRVPADRVLGGEPGQGFYQMMDGVEVGRVNVAARGCGVALRAFELGVRYAQQRASFGKALHEHQANPHVHLSVRAESRFGARLNPRKADLHRWRETFAEKLRGWGIDAEATRQRTRGQVRNYEPIWRVKAATEGRLKTSARTTKSGEGLDKDQAIAAEAWNQIVDGLSRSDSSEDRALAEHVYRFLFGAFATDSGRKREVGPLPQVSKTLNIVASERHGPDVRR